ncbi:MAG: helix-turn-helix domain-containing protein [Bacteroidetes bacterium]|nr:helix-turn-helix domain-containing protein [Bacteroidota bacterium]
MMSTIDSANSSFQRALRFVNQTAQHIFLTGKAGTGKTTFLKYIRDNGFKKMAIVAPTGVAAINAGGVTMHSFFQLPFGPFIPTQQQQGWNQQSVATDQYGLLKNIRFNHAKRELLRELDLLVIDEVSMVRADMLDAVDIILRHFIKQPLLPFGGLQVLFIGDLFQLPPVVNRSEWEILREYYDSPFFFDAQVLKQSPPVYLELKKIYRQNDAHFINILNNIRNNQCTREDLEILHQHYHPEFQPSRAENYIMLTTHNNRADYINQQELDKLNEKLFSFDAVTTGDFDERAYPAEKQLNLKQGAQVMFIKNDKGEARRFFNGKIGIVARINAEEIFIRFPEEQSEILLEKETWKNIRYNFNREKGTVEEEPLGTFTQYPIRLAWAITIHKSQGLTFDKAIIDAGASFAPGQVYVALSRLTSMDGLVLYSRINPDAIQVDPRVLNFARSEMAEDQLQELFSQEQKIFIMRFIAQSFTWEKLVEVFVANEAEYDHRQIQDKALAYRWAQNMLKNIREQHEVSLKFGKQLEQLLQIAEEDKYVTLQKRIAAACDYFIQHLDQTLVSIQKHIDEMKIKLKSKKYVRELRELLAVVKRKKQQLQHVLGIVDGLMKGTDVDHLFQMTDEKTNEVEEGQSPITTTKKIETQKESKPKPQKGDSHKMTLELFRQNKSVAEIAALRGLTYGTVENHLITFIATGDVSVDEIVPVQKLEHIITKIRENGPSSLTAIKDKLGIDYSFGEIRAVFRHLERTENAGS